MSQLHVLPLAIFVAVVATLSAWNTHKSNVELKGEYAECRQAVTQAHEVVAIERDIGNVDVDKWLLDADLIRDTVRDSPNHKGEQ